MEENSVTVANRNWEAPVDQENINNANEMKELASVNIAANYPIAEDEAQAIRLGKEKEG